MMKRQIPNLITLCNLICGVIAILYAIKGQVATAAVFILLGIFFDFFDGLTARLLHVASPLGKELDSLADVVTSGVAPCFILYTILGELAPEGFLPWVSLLMPAFSAYRLGKFNLDERQHQSFLGLPAPANALIWVGLGLAYCEVTDTECFGKVTAPILAVLSLITDVLLISEIPMFSLKFNFKEMGWKNNRVRYIFLIGCIAILVGGILLLPGKAFFISASVIIVWYILLSIATQRKEVVHG